MSRVTHGDVTANKMELVAIEIPINTGDGSSVDALKGVQDYDAKIISWEIVQNVNAFQWARAADMAAPVVSADADEGLAPPVGKFALPEIFLRSASAATVAAVLVLYTAKDDVIAV